MDTINALLKSVHSATPAADDAIRALGLLLEQRTARRPADDGGLLELIDFKLATYRLTQQEANLIVEDLAAAAVKKGAKPGLLWALAKSKDKRALAVFRVVLKQTLQDPKQQPLAEQALQGLLTFGTVALPEIKYAAEQGRGEVQEAAQDYLDIFG